MGALESWRVHSDIGGHIDDLGCASINIYQHIKIVPSREGIPMMGGGVSWKADVFCLLAAIHYTAVMHSVWMVLTWSQRCSYAEMVS